MAVFLAFPILGFGWILQLSLIRQINLLHGSADLILLILISWTLHHRVKHVWQWAILACVLAIYISASPFGSLGLSYLVITGCTVFFRSRFWKLEAVTILISTLVGTFISHIFMILGQSFSGANIPLDTALIQITLPSMFLNLLLVIPFYALISSLADWTYPQELGI